MLSKPTLAEAADDDTTTTLSLPRADTGFREPSSGGSVVLRGTRSVSPASTHAPNMRNQARLPYTGWRPEQRDDRGWSTDYD